MNPNRFALPAALLCVLITAVAEGSDSPRLRAPTHLSSDRDLLEARERLARPLAERLAPSPPRAGADADTITVAAVRIEFLQEVPDDPDTSGDGTFDYSTGNPGDLDPPPHDAAYFERQLLALRNYYSAVSAGRLALDTTLFPAGDREAFRLPQFMGYYNPDTTQAALDVRLAEFFRDCVDAADADVVFGDFDVVMIFHAGIGQDILTIDVPPSDIPSAFISFAELKAALAPDDPDFAGISADGGAHAVRDGFWVPESDVLPATDNRPQIDFSLTGVMVSLMGSQLGLPSLFNTASGAPGIGRFGLMDQGAGNELGRLPAAPCGWSRFFLGWETPVIAQDRAGVELAAALSGLEPAKLALIPIDSREYWLIENRQQDLDGDGSFTLIDSLGTIVGVVADEYDAGIPGSGLLIWHIDEEVIDRGLADNTVNADFRHRGVDLEEADGVEDIGLRPNGGFGLPEDAFYDPNATRFASDTLPPSWSNHGHDPHITVENISGLGRTMSFDVKSELFQPGWPDSTRLDLDGISITAGTTGSAGDAALAVVSAEGTLSVRTGGGARLFPDVDFAAEARGMPLIVPLDPLGDSTRVVAATAEGVRVLDPDGNELPAWSRALGPAPGGEVIRVLEANDVPSLSEVRLAMLGADGQLHVWNATGDAPGFPFDPGAPLRSNLADAGFSHGFGHLPELAFIAGNELHVQPLGDGLEARRLPLPPAVGTGPLWLAIELVGNFSQVERYFWIIERAGTVHVLDDVGSPLPGWPRRTGDRHEGPPALADLRRDGALDLVLPGTGRLWVLSRTGALHENWPVDVDTATVGMPITSGPLIADLDGEGGLDVAIGSPAGGLFAWNASGHRLAGFPLPAGAGNTGTPTVADLDGDGDLELAAADTAGWLYVYDLDAEAPEADADGFWGERGSADRSFAAQLRDPQALPSGELLAEPSLVLYPNPTSGPTSIRFELGGAEDPSLQVRILDAVGRTVRELAATGVGGTLNEVRWDGRDGDGNAVPSGVYLVRVTARAGGRSAQHLRTLAVTR